MSHFSVAVFTKPNGATVDELLAPYYEGIEMEPYIQYTRQEAIDKVRKETREYMESPRYKEYLENPEAYKAKCESRNNMVHFEYISTYHERLNWTDEQCYEEEKQWFEDDMIDEEGNLLSTYNPKSKWDWYSIGGRFPGKLKSKIGEHGEGSAFRNNPRVDGKFDSAKVGDIDFSMDMDAYDKAIRYWEVIVEKQPLTANEDKDDFVNWYRDGYYEEYYRDKETFAKICASYNTYAVVTPDGKWWSKGDMLYFGASTETGNESLDWDLHYKERSIDTADPDWTLTIVDCHI